MRNSIRLVAAAFAALSLTFVSIAAVAQRDAAADRARQLEVVSDFKLDVARLTEASDLLRPDNLDQWVFLGTSLGLGYEEVKTDPDSPGNFQVVLMEPKAYEYFKVNGKYADGSMFLLSIYGTQQQRSAERSGFSQKDLLNFEIHLIDRERYADGRAFFLYKKDDMKAKAQPPGNVCVQCHVQNAAFGGTFAQFYPAIRHRIPAEMLDGRH
jgi:Cytochrome P460